MKFSFVYMAHEVASVVRLESPLLVNKRKTTLIISLWSGEKVLFKSRHKVISKIK